MIKCTCYLTYFHYLLVQKKLHIASTMDYFKLSENNDLGNNDLKQLI